MSLFRVLRLRLRDLRRLVAGRRAKLLQERDQQDHEEEGRRKEHQGAAADDRGGDGSHLGEHDRGGNDS